MKSNSVLNLSLSAALILGFTLTLWPTSAHGNNSGNGSLNGGGIQSASDDGSQPNNPPPAVDFDQNDLDIIKGYYLDLIDANLSALSRPGLSAEEVEALTIQIAEAQAIVAFVAQIQALVPPEPYPSYCAGIDQKVEEISARICELNKAYKEAKCDKWPYYNVPSVCQMYCLPEFEAWIAAYTAKNTAHDALMTCLGANPDDGDIACNSLVKALATAIAAEKAAESAYKECLKKCEDRLPGYMPYPKCQDLWDKIQKAKNELKNLCGSMEIGPNGQPTGNPNMNVLCKGCQKVAKTNYEPIQCAAPQ